MPSPRSSSSYSSSSSRSSSSSSRSSSSSGPSSRSSSSYSSSSRSSSSYSSSRSHSSSPSSRSRTSYSSPSRYVAGGSMKGRTISRSRRNQPRGYVVKEHSYRSPTNHMCVNHNYVYYPDDWTDSSGTSYRKGYYDENGTYYENVIFKQNGRYNKVPCRCQYCGVTTNINLTSEQTLLCSRCGAPLEIQAALDEYTQDPLYTRENPPLTAGQKIRRVLLKPWVIILLALLGLGIFAANKDSTEVAYPMAEEIRAPYEYASLSNLELFGEQIRLNRTEDGSYVFAPASADSWDKELNWNDDEGFFYDADSDCWLDYNTDLDPAVWQYWYEGISSDFGDCGWMEYADGAWHVEASPGNWILLPDRYDSARLWHLEEGLAPISSNAERFGEQIRLNRTEDGSYVFAPASADSWDKELNWNDDEGFFYDADSDCWLDYNTDLDPAVWQYWYEGISSDFGDCGWMEYADGAWHVEASPGNWIPLPDKYDSSGLWHLEPGPAEHS